MLDHERGWRFRDHRPHVANVQANRCGEEEVGRSRAGQEQTKEQSAKHEVQHEEPEDKPGKTKTKTKTKPNLCKPIKPIFI